MAVYLLQLQVLIRFVLFSFAYYFTICSSFIFLILFLLKVFITIFSDYHDITMHIFYAAENVASKILWCIRTFFSFICRPFWSLNLISLCFSMIKSVFLPFLIFTSEKTFQPIRLRPWTNAYTGRHRKHGFLNVNLRKAICLAVECENNIFTAPFALKIIR